MNRTQLKRLTPKTKSYMGINYAAYKLDLSDEEKEIEQLFGKSVLKINKYRDQLMSLRNDFVHGAQDVLEVQKLANKKKIERGSATINQVLDEVDHITETLSDLFFNSETLIALREHEWGY